MNLLCFEVPEITNIRHLRMNLSTERIARNLFLLIVNKNITSMILPVLHFELILFLDFGFEGI